MLGKIEDIKIGKASENVVIELLRTITWDVYNTDTINKFDYFDFRSDIYKIDFELKSRNIYKGQYPTIFFGENKLIEGRLRKQNGRSKRIIYLFRFNKKKDSSKKAVYFWEDDGSDLQIIKCGNFQRGEKAKPLVNLPIKLLKKFKYLTV